MAKRPKPIAKFRIYPGGRRSTIYFRVFIWPTMKVLRERFRAIHNIAPSRRLFGWCDGGRTLVQGKWRATRNLGSVHLCIKSTGAGMVSHELGHAAFRWIERKKLRIPDKDPVVAPFTLAGKAEEEYCLALERLMRTFYDRYYQLKLAKPGDYAPMCPE